jgi:protein involved in polysaccharide export with SLBB domain
LIVTDCFLCIDLTRSGNGKGMTPRKFLSLTLLGCALAAAGCAAGPARSDRAGAVAPGASRLRPDCFTAAAADDGLYRIQPGDKLHISFYLNSEFDTDAAVRPDGRIELAAAGEVMAAGLRPVQLESRLNQLYSSELRNPGASVRVDESPSRVVFVESEVGHPGTVPLQPGMTALQAIAAAGGLTETAGPGNVVLVRHDACGEPYDAPLDLAKALKRKGHQDDVVLAPADMLIVPRSGIAQADLMVKQYVRDLLPVTPYVSAPLF